MKNEPSEPLGGAWPRKPEALRLLQAGLDGLSHGFGFFDGDLQLVACNRAFAELGGYPPTLCRPGTPLADFLRHEAERADGTEPPPGPTLEARPRGAHGPEPRAFERQLPDGRVVL